MRVSHTSPNGTYYWLHTSHQHHIFITSLSIQIALGIFLSKGTWVSVYHPLSVHARLRWNTHRNSENRASWCHLILNNPKEWSTSHVAGVGLWESLCLIPCPGEYTYSSVRTLSQWMTHILSAPIQQWLNVERRASLKQRHGQFLFIW